MVRFYREGFGRVRRAGWLVAGLWGATLLLALPAAVMLHGEIAAHLGASETAARVAAGVDLDWWNEFLAQASGLGQTFVPATTGFAAVLDNLSRIADNGPLATALAVTVGAHLLLSLFLAGGVVDRLARDRRVGVAAFFAACGVWGVRFLRLAVLAGTAYWFLFAWVHHWLLEAAYTRLTADVSVERTAFAVRAALYLVFAVLVCTVNVLVDYAKIRAVVEDRRSMIGALVAGARFVIRHPAQTGGLYLLNLAGFLVLISAYAALAPGAAAGLSAFAIGQAYIVGRVIVRLGFVASQTALFQAKLAHAGYVARPVPSWPDSPSAEAMAVLAARVDPSGSEQPDARRA